MRLARDRARRSADAAAFDADRPPGIPGLTGLTRIGGGASATVYRGDEPAMRRKVAVKVLHAAVRDARGRQVFERECALAGQAGQHPSAANLYTSGFAGDRPYIVMQYYARGSMAGRLLAGHQFFVAEVLSTGVQICGALQFAHDHGILHRDVKPENILSDGFGVPVLADFGIASDRDDGTVTLQYAMTPAFAAPEVLQRGGGWPVSDVWSLAATLYALLAGCPPFYDTERADPRANLQAIAGLLPPVRRADVPGHLQDTLARALIGEPDNRTASARRLAEELNADEQRLGLAPTPIQVDLDDSGGSGHHAGLPADRGAAGSSPGPPSPAPPAGQYPAPAPARFPLPGLPAAMLPTTGRDSGVRGAADGPPGDRRPADRRPADSRPADSRPADGLPADRRAGRRPESPAASQLTGNLPTGESYRLAETPPAPASRRTIPRALIAAAGLSVLVAVGAIYALAGPGRGPAKSPAGAAVTSPARTSGSSPAASAGAPPPPADVTAVAMGRSSARISWKDTVPRGQYPVVISLGAGNGTRAVADHSPQVITGLGPAKPYCFAVGYVYTLQGKTSYAVRPACIRGGVAGPAGG